MPVSYTHLDVYKRQAISSFYHRSYLPPFMKRFQKRYPNVKINVVDAFSNEQSKLLLQGEVDLGIASLDVYKRQVQHQSVPAVPEYQRRPLMRRPTSLLKRLKLISSFSLPPLFEFLNETNLRNILE